MLCYAVQTPGTEPLGKSVYVATVGSFTGAERAPRLLCLHLWEREGFRLTSAAARSTHGLFPALVHGVTQSSPLGGMRTDEALLFSSLAEAPGPACLPCGRRMAGIFGGSTHVLQIGFVMQTVYGVFKAM